MYSNDIQIRVRYAETDKMGYVYYAHYATYFEVARVEMLRCLGITYKKLEEEGIILPVIDFSIKYIRPAFYDSLLTVTTVIKEIPVTKICFNYETFNEKKELINVAETTLVFVNKSTGRPCRPPADLLEALRRFY